MGMNIIEFIDKEVSRYCPVSELYDVSPFNLTDFRDCFIMELIKDAYFETEPKQSLRASRGTDADDVRMRDSRYAAYAQHYRKLQFNHIKNDIGIEIQELLPDDMSDMKKKLEGHKFTEMQYFELNTIASHPLLKAIVSKRICDVKKISNTAFLDYMRDYDELTKGLSSKLEGSDDDVIFATIALFTLEWKYNVELFYSCAVNAENRSSQDVPIQKVAALCAELSIPLPPDFTERLHTESRFILHRMNLVPSIYDGSNWDEIEDKLYHYFTIRYYLKQIVIHKWSLLDYFCRITTRKQWADFIREHYDMRKIYTPKEWTSKRIRYVRNLYRVMTRNLETPKL